jgi:predicted nucleic acid-binding protein
MVLSGFGRARRLQDLQRLVAEFRTVTTRAVLDEIRAGVNEHPELGQVATLPWLHVEALDGLEELRLFAEYTRLLGAGTRDLGEATVLAWAEVHRAIAFTDDNVAVRVARSRGVEVRRTLALVARGVRRSILSENEAEAIVRDLLRAETRFPIGAGEFLAWARANGLL